MQVGNYNLLAYFEKLNFKIMKTKFAVIQHGNIIETFNNELIAQEYKRLIPGCSKVEPFKMNNRLYKRAYRFLELRAKGKDPFKAIDKLNYFEYNLVIDFLKFQHQIRVI